MASAMDAVKSILPLPENVADPGKEEVAQTITDEPTISHALAVADHDDKGHAQQEHDDMVKNLGWHEQDENIPDPLIGKLPNEELWLLLRRFNKQIYDVKELYTPAPGGLDLNIADDEAFSPDKLRSSVERLYMTVIIGALSVFKHIARLRSWRESKRTASFCAIYFIAWLFDFIVPLVSAALITLIVYPPSRDYLFPPAPLSLVDAKTGGVQKPKAGVLGSHDSATGAPENLKGEAVEAEANTFVTSLASIALASASGKHPNDAVADDPADFGVPDPTAIAATAGDARVNAVGSKTGSVKANKVKEPMENAMWSKMRPVMHSINEISDTWERFGNALSPTPPFPRNIDRIRLAGLVVPLLAASILVSSYMFMKGLTFGVGFGFFGDPIISRGMKLLNREFPHWQKILEVRNTILKGVPTNAQLTLTLLRIGEANKTPLPPPPIPGQAPPDEPAAVSTEELQTSLNVGDAELQGAIEHDPNVTQEDIGEDAAAAKAKSHGKTAKRILSVAKKGLKATVEGGLGADHLKAKAGSKQSKQRLGVVPRDRSNNLSGPVEFKCRYEGKRGHAYISTKETIPCIGFSVDKTITTDGAFGKVNEELHPIWSVAIADIRELKKVGGLGWKAKLVVGWALDREVADGMEILDKEGNRFVVTAMTLRDEFFNRLIAMGGQKWEAW